MIQFSLKCTNGHGFDSWFKSGAAFEQLQTGRMVECPICGSPEVTKALMSPRLSTGGDKEPTPLPVDRASLALAPSSELEMAIARLREQVRENSDYVGDKFATEARLIHSGEAPQRAIYGEAALDDARRLVEDGIPVLPLPFRTGGKSN